MNNGDYPVNRFPIAELFDGDLLPAAYAEDFAGLFAAFDALTFSYVTVNAAQDALELGVVIEPPIDLRLAPFGPESFSIAPVSDAVHARVRVGDERVRLDIGTQVAFGIPRALLRPVDGADPITLTVPVRLRAHWQNGSGIDLDVDFPGGWTLPPAEIGGSGFVIEASGLTPILGAGQLPDDLQGFEDDFRGIYVELAAMRLPDWLDLPLPAALQIAGCAIGTQGFSGSLSALFTPTLVSADAGQPARFEGVGAATLFGLSLGLEQLSLSIEANRFYGSTIAGRLLLPLLDTPIAMSGSLSENGSRIGAAFDYADSIQLSGPGFAMTVSGLAGSGTIDLEQGYVISGTVAALQLTAGSLLDVSLSNAAFALDIQATQWNFAFALAEFDFGPLGRLQEARANIARAGDAAFSLTIQAKMVWGDIATRLDLPASLPTPAPGTEVEVYLSWVDSDAGQRLQLRLLVEAEEIDLGFLAGIPQGFRPTLRNASLLFEADYQDEGEFSAADTSGALSGNISARLEARLPELPPLPGTDLLRVETGGEEGWIGALMSVSLDAAGRPDVSIALDQAVAVAVNLPDLPQGDPPIQVRIEKIGFDIDSSAEGIDGGFKLAGSFRLQPIDPTDLGISVPPMITSHLQALLRGAGLVELVGQASLAFRFNGENSAIDLACEFTEPAPGLQLDLFDMLAGAARGLPAPGGVDGEANAIDLDIEVGFELRRIAMRLGSVSAASSAQVQMALSAGFNFAGAHTDLELRLSEQEVSFGFEELAIPIEIPELPMRLDDLNQLRGPGGHWDHGKWLNTVEPGIAGDLTDLSEAIALYQTEIDALEAELPTLDSSQARTAKQIRLKRLKERCLPAANKASVHLNAKRFLIEGILAIYNLMSTFAARTQFQTFAEAYQALVDSTLGAIHLDTRLLFVLSDIKLVLPFENPSDIRVEGGARITGFAPDSPFAPIGDLELKLGLSAEYIYFAVEGGGDPIPLPKFGRYRDGGIDLKHIRFAYGYSKNSFAVAFAGALKLPKALVNDADTSGALGAGIRLPVETRLAFNLDLIPVVLGEVDFVIPLFKFDLDLRQPDIPGIGDSRLCTPAWDGLQLIVPDVIRLGFKRTRFSPFFGPLPAPNYTVGYDVQVGNRHNGVTLVCDNYLVITPVAGQYPVPFIADSVPFFDNLCVRLDVAGFVVNFNLQRPFPKMSPMAVFEVMGLLSDPAMPIDPNGALADSIRATIEKAYIGLPPQVVRMFPELGNVVEREVNHTINLGTLVTLSQAAVPWLQGILEQVEASTDDIQATIQAVKDHPPELAPLQLLAMLPAELRQLRPEGALGGFAASALIMLMTAQEAYREFDRRAHPQDAGGLDTLLRDEFDVDSLADWEIVNQGHRSPVWNIADGALRQGSDTHRNQGPLRPGTFVLSTRLQTEANTVTETVMRTETGGAGVMFLASDKNNYYRFAVFDKNEFELLKVRDGKARVLFHGGSVPAPSSRYHIVIDTDLSKRSAPSPRAGASAKTAACRSARPALRIRIHVNGAQWCSTFDVDDFFTAGSIGLYAWKNPDARFDRVQVSTPSRSTRLRPGDAISPQALFSYRPKLPDHEPPLFDPQDAANNLFLGAEFFEFDASTLDALEISGGNAGGVVVAAEVSVFEQQNYRFLGYLFADGRFSLVSALNLSPLRLRIAGIPLELPMQLQGRLALTGQTRGAATQAAIEAQGWADWPVLPNVLRMTLGDPSEPVSLRASSNGRFAIAGSGQLDFFSGAALLDGSLDISETHCLVTGSFDFRPDFFIDGKRVLHLHLDSSGRVGPADRFLFSGSGTLALLENEAVAVAATVSDQEIALKLTLDLPKWNGLPIDEMRLDLTGSIVFGPSPKPDFLLQGEALLKGFKGPGNDGLEIRGQGGIQASNGELLSYVSGGLRWQSRDWLQGRIELGTQGVRIQGSTSFALELLDLPDNLNTQFASLYFSIEIAGHFALNRKGQLLGCGLETHWTLGIKLPGAEQQLVPVAMQAIDVSLDHLAATNQLVKLLELVTIDSLSILPMEAITLPVPQITPTSYTRLYLSNVSRGGGSQSIPMLKQRAATHTNQLFRIPTSIEFDDEQLTVDLPQLINDFFNVEDPGVTVKKPSLSNYRSFYLGSEQVNFPIVSVPQLKATHTPGATKLLEVPTGYAVSAATQSLGNLLDKLDCTISLGWKGLDLGIVVTRKGKDKFTPFRAMFA